MRYRLETEIGDRATIINRLGERVAEVKGVVLAEKIVDLLNAVSETKDLHLTSYRWSSETRS